MIFVLNLFNLFDAVQEFTDTFGQSEIVNKTWISWACSKYKSSLLFTSVAGTQLIYGGIAIIGDVVKLFFWVSFYYIFKKTKAFHFKSKAFLSYSDKFPKNQKLFVWNQKLFFFILRSFLQTKSFSF